MTPENFCYWLKGYFEILDPELKKSEPGVDNKYLTGEQVKIIEQHLGYVFLPKIKIETIDTKNKLGGFIPSETKIC